MAESKLEGSCLCGAVELQVTPTSHNVSACHCKMCKKWGGGPLLAVECEGDIEFSGEELIAVFDSSEWAERGFCSRCGSHLFYRLKEGGHQAIPVGLLKDQGWMLTEEIFIDAKPDFYSFSEDTKKLTGAELFALFTPTG